MDEYTRRMKAGDISLGTSVRYKATLFKVIGQLTVPVNETLLTCEENSQVEPFSMDQVISVSNDITLLVKESYGEWR